MAKDQLEFNLQTLLQQTVWLNFTAPEVYVVLPCGT